MIATPRTGKTAELTIPFLGERCRRILPAIFSNDDAVILASADYLKAYAIDCLLTCFLFCFVGFFNGMGYTAFVMVQGIIGT